MIGITRYAVIFCYLCVVKSYESFAQQATTSNANPSFSSELTIQSSQMEADLKNNRVVFWEKVFVSDKDYSLSTDKLTVFLSESDRQPEKILAEGRVKIVQDDLASESEKATILPLEDKVILEGNAVVRRGKNMFQGQKVEFTRSTGRVVVREGVRVSIADLASLNAPESSSPAKNSVGKSSSSNGESKEN